MPYVNGSATDPTDLLQQLVTFLAANGWTTDLSTAEGSGWRAHLHNGGNYVHLRGALNEQPWLFNSNSGYGLHVYMGTAFNGSNAWNNQPTGAPIASGGSNPIGCAASLSAGPYTNHYFFCDASGNNVAVVIERSPGFYVHIGFGTSLLKAGSWTGGPYIFGSTSGFYCNATLGANTPGFTSTSFCPGINGDAEGGSVCMVRVDVDSFTGQWVGIINTASPNQGYTGKFGTSAVIGLSGMSQNTPKYGDAFSAFQFQAQQVSVQDGRANLLPVILFVGRDGTTTGFSMIGSIPFVFQTNGVGNGFSNASEYPLGSDTYKMFPNFAILKQ